MTTFGQRVHDLGGNVSKLTWVGFGLIVAFLAFAAFIVAGEALTHPGGWTGLGFTALWLVPTLALTALVIYRGDRALPVLAVVALLPVGFGVWTLLDFGAAMAWEDRTGPVSLLLVLVVGLPLALAGLSRPVQAGALLLAITVVPWVLSVMGAGGDRDRAFTIGLITVPVVAGGLLLLLAGWLRDGAGSHLGRRHPLPGH